MEFITPTPPSPPQLSPLDPTWRHTKPAPMQPSPERLAAKHQLVTLRNNHGTQVHIVLDRFNQPVELKPGETKRDVDMLVEDIVYFASLAEPGKFDIYGFPRPVHPVKIMDRRDPPPDPKIDPERFLSAIPSGQQPLPDSVPMPESEIIPSGQQPVQLGGSRPGDNRPRR